VVGYEREGKRSLEELSLVTLRQDIPAHALRAGDIGTIVLVHSDGEAYEVEFARTGPRPSALLTLREEQIAPLAGGRITPVPRPTPLLKRDHPRA
jgi:hypothetical protein